MKFDCGCDISFPIDYYNIREDCPKTWKLLQSGKTQGVFQIETQFAQQYCKKLHPECIEDIGALSSIIRPGTSQVKLDGKTATQRFIDRKNKLEPIPKYHPQVDEILKDVYNLIVYQENSIELARILAGFSLEDADILRRAMGQKLADLMTEVEIKFIEGAKKVGILTEEQAKEVFGWIRRSERYSFNKCLSPTTIVETKTEFKILEEIEVGEYIKCPFDNQDIYCQVINKYDNGVQDLYEVTLESGKTIECTMEHKFLCSDGQKYPLWEIIENNIEIMIESD